MPKERSVKEAIKSLKGIIKIFECTEGQSRSRNVVIEFADYATAVACYRSPEYQANLKIRQANAISDMIIVEGYDGPQP